MKRRMSIWMFQRHRKTFADVDLTECAGVSRCVVSATQDSKSTFLGTITNAKVTVAITHIR